MGSWSFFTRSLVLSKMDVWKWRKQDSEWYHFCAQQSVSATSKQARHGWQSINSITSQLVRGFVVVVVVVLYCAVFLVVSCFFGWLVVVVLLLLLLLLLLLFVCCCLFVCLFVILGDGWGCLFCFYSSLEMSEPRWLHPEDVKLEGKRHFSCVHTHRATPNKYHSETRMTASVLNQHPNTSKVKRNAIN